MTTNIDKDAIGIEVSWSFGNGDAEAVTLPRVWLREALTANGFDPKLIPVMDGDSALSRAALVVKGRSRTIVIQEMRRPNKDTPRAFGVYQVQPKEGEAGDNIVCGSRVRVDKASDRVVCLDPEGASSIEECSMVGRELARIANSLIDNAINRNISDALVDIGWEGGWISRRRNSGGVYFMDSGDRAERFVSLLKLLSSKTRDDDDTIFRARQFVPQIMEVYPKPLTMDLWSGAAKEQYAVQVKELVDQLATIQTDDSVRGSTIEKRAAECDRVIALAEKHRTFLQDYVEVVTKELLRVKGEFQKKLDENAAEARVAFEAADALAPAVQPTVTPEVKPKGRTLKTKKTYTDKELFEV